MRLDAAGDQAEFFRRLEREDPDYVAPDLREPLLPAPGYFLVDVYEELDRTRSAGFDTNPIPYSEIEAYSRVGSLGLDPWQVRVVRRIDDVFRAVRYELQEERQKRHEAQAAK